MRTLLLLVFFAHGLLHLLGPLRTFGWVDDPSLPEVTMPFAVVFLLSAACLLAAGVTLWTGWGYWWALAAGGVVLSQIAIVASWSEAWAGTVLNVVVLLAALLGYGAWSSGRHAAALRKDVVSTATPIIVTHAALEGVPEVVARWLARSGVVAGTSYQWALLEQDLLLKLSPEQNKWFEGRAEQVISADPTAFAWTVEVAMNPVTRVYGYDRYAVDGAASAMYLFGLADLSGGVPDRQKLLEASAHRYLAELPWFPPAALTQAIEWRQLDGLTAEATLRYSGGRVSGRYTFDSSGDFVRFDADRFRDTDAAAQREPWVGHAMAYGEFDGLRVPTELDVTWSLADGDWTWLQIQVVDLATDRALAQVERSAALTE